jgi:uncharacterized membrane protein
LVGAGAACDGARDPLSADGAATGAGCAGAPCLHGGTCSPTPDGGFTCACPPGYAGLTCASNIDDCLPNPCRNGGSCVDGVAGATCLCPSTVTGDRCQLPRFQALVTTPCGGATPATAVSANGRAVVGFCGSHAAMLWTVAAGVVDLGISSATATDAIPFAVNGDGSALLSRFRRSDGTAGVLRWEAGAGTTDLFLQPSGASLFANAATRDLSVVIGSYADPNLPAGDQLAFRYTPAAGLAFLKVPDGSAYGCGAFATSADGTVTVGACYDAGGLLRAARWRVAGADLPIDLLDASPSSSYANGVSADGRVIVGYVVAGTVVHEFRFEDAGPLEDIGALPSAGTASALAVSGDGSVVVGIAEQTSYPFTDFATVWDRANGMRAVADVLTAAGVDISGWLLTSAVAVSDDGKVIVGNGYGPDLISRFWLARVY